ncbi:MAG: PIG-L family deacetylase [Christiangramia sp.]|uniref:PIG-L family deacetylase n=1 Tax=Christiangramia sp. TaxID=1931228 RepID=UPI003241C57E
MRKVFLALFLLQLTICNAQAPEKWSSAEIYEHIKKLNFLGSVLYVAAHPDDENTRLISYFSNDVHARTAYLALTRGDGGQNLIGPELREELGLIRTQELLEARKIDGGYQFFSRANDFGYSKNPTETLQFWDKEEVLSDIVWVIRKFQPDVIINRFDHRTPGSTHGHHTTSAILSVEAFDMAVNTENFPEQLKFVDTYQPKRLFFNTSPWFYGGNEAFQEADKSNFVSFDTGTYFPVQGLSNPEIASLSRSQHKSQGFGSTGSRGSEMEYLELLKGDKPSDQDVFDGIDTSWSRLDNGKEIGKLLASVENEFDFEHPEKSLEKLLQAYKLIGKLQDEHWKNIKLAEIKEIIYACSGLFLEASTGQPSATASETLPLKLEAINRSNAAINLKKVLLNPGQTELTVNVDLENNKDWSSPVSYTIPKNANFTSPYWLKEPGTTGMYRVEDQQSRGLPEDKVQTTATFQLDINGTSLEFEKPIVYKFNDNVSGENYRNFEIVPMISVEFQDDVLIFNEEKPQTIRVELQSHNGAAKGKISLKAGKNWKIEPASQEFDITEKGGAVSVDFEVTPPAGQDETELTAEATVNDQSFSNSLKKIEYPHISNQNIIRPAKLKLVRLNIAKKGERIAYVPGAGDVVDESLRQIGYQVQKLEADDISASRLQNFDAVVLGIRAYNVDDALAFKQSALFDYVKNGGTLIVQYNTNRGLVTEDLAPFHLELSRDRVTEEDAEVTFIAPNHALLNVPNKLTKADFDGWVQERGLYFPGNWDDTFTPILSMHDQDESAKTGSLLVAQYGKGYFIYTGISFFRQLPAGVPGAYRLFANMISIGK